jgi:hypothetical protein
MPEHTRSYSQQRIGAGRCHEPGYPRGRPRATPAEAVEVELLHGFFRGSVVVPPEIDLTAPIADEAFAADEDVIHW